MEKEAVKQRAISILSDEIVKNRLIVFVGAGCSLSAGLPSWRELVDSLLKEYHIETKDTDLLRLASRIEREVGKLKLRESIAERLRTRPEIESPLHDKLVRLDVNLFVTTNYDHLLEDTFRKSGYSPMVITDDKDVPAIDLGKKTIVKLHGDMDSASSMVISKPDYTRYKTSHKGFVEWLNATVAQNTMLFLGTSFDDPRLNDADDHVLELFGDFRRQPFILLKRPQKRDSAPEGDFEIDLADLEARCEDFRDRGFFVVPIDQYDEIPDILQDVQTKALERKRQSDMSGFESGRILQADHLAALEKNLRGLLDEKTLQLSEHVLGKGRLPTFLVMAERAEALITHLENAPLNKLSPEARLEGYLTLADAFLNSNKQEDMNRTRQYYERANAAYDESGHQADWQERLLRIRAKLLFFEGKTDNAIDSLAHSHDPKTVSLWLALLIDSGRSEKAYDYVSTHPKPHPAWVCQALSVLIETGHIQEAEEIYAETLGEYCALQKQGQLKDSEFRGEFFYEKLHFFMAHAFFNRAMRLTGKPKFSTIYPGQLNHEGEQLCEKALLHIDRLFEQASRKNVFESYVASLALGIEMSVAHLLGEINRADKAAKDLLSVRPLMREVARYVLIRATHFDRAALEKASNYLAHDYPDSWWAFEMVAFLEGVHLKNDEASWAALKKAVALVASREEKEKVAITALDLGFELGLQDKSLAIVYDLLETDNDLRRLLEAKYQYRIGNTAKADESFANLEKENFPPDISSEIKFFRGKFAIKKKEWERAREFLEASIKLVPSSIAMKDLLRVYMQLQDNAKALAIAEQIGKIGEDDELVIHAKAWAARNLGHFQISEEAWQRLKEYGQKSEYAYGLAEVMFLRGNPSKALQALKQFIQCNDETDPACLSLACSIHESGDGFPEAFRLLHNCYDKIQNNPQLLMKYMDLGYRVDQEKKAHEALMRLEALRQEGKVPEEAFVRLDLDQVLEMFRQRRETAKKVNDLYRQGRFPRLMICEHKNMPLYMDWAVRTQEWFPDDPEEWIDFTTYSTNGMRIERVKQRNQLTPISALPDATEIVIDYHALITVHRLGLIDTIQQRYRKIYYPYVLEIIWTNDQRRFGHHQLSKEKAYRTLNERLIANQISEMAAPISFEAGDKEKDTPAKRNLRLARLEKMLVIDAFVKEKDLADFEDITVIRLSQLVDWLYARGKIGENRLRELSAVCRGELEIVKTDCHKLIEDTPRLLVSETTLELMEQYDLNQHVLGLGKQIVIENYTAHYIRQAVLEIDFGKEVGEWHQDLSKLVRDSNVFESVHPDIDPKDRVLLDTPYYEGSVSAIKYAAKAELFLLTDDRMTQMIREKEWANRQFGTDALLTDLFENGKITIDKYANGFLQLCRWRYRFLLPDVRVLLFFARQYKKKPLGKPLNEIATYGRQCMEDTGLFLGPEPTVPPLPLGIKFQMVWVERWLAFLASVWQDDDFTRENLEQITRKVYEQAIPGPAKGLKDEIRENYSGLEDKFIVGQLFILASNAETPYTLHGLLSQTFQQLGHDEKRQEEELKEHLERLLEYPGMDRRIMGKVMVIPILMAFYGKRDNPPVSPLLHPIMVEFGLIDESQDSLPKDLEKSREVGGHRLDELPDRITAQQRLPDYEATRPLIRVPPPHRGKHGVIFVPHELIQAATAELRITALNDILDYEKVSKFTKALVKKKADNIKSSTRAVWRPAAAEASEVILKDFRYASSLFAQAMPMTPPNKEWIDAAWRNVMTPNLDSVWSELPGFIIKRWSDKTLRKKLHEEFESKKNKGVRKRFNPVSTALDWYMEHMGFAPLGHQYDVRSIVNGVLRVGKDLEPEPASVGKNKNTELNSVSVLRAVQDWISEKQDPLAYLAALQMILNARHIATDNQKTEFTNKTFFDVLNGLFDVLVKPETRTGHTESNLKLRSIQATWTNRVSLAQHYLRYLDINAKGSLNEEEKVLAAWWMAREVTSALADSMKHYRTEDQIAVMETDVPKAIEDMAEPIRITHLFAKIDRPQSPQRFCTFYGNDLPACATLALLMPHQTEDPEADHCFRGITEPTKALSGEIRDTIIEKLIRQLVQGLGQLPSKEDGKTLQLWNIPLCVSVPAFLREYYGDNIEYLGQEKMTAIGIAEAVSKSGFLDEELPLLPRRIEDNEGPLATTVVLTSLYVFLCTRGKMPKSARVFEDAPMLARNISRLKDSSGWHCLLILLTILCQLQAWGDFKWAGVIAKLFRHVDYSGMSDSSTMQVVGGAISVVLLGVEYALLKPILDMGASDKKVRDALGRSKEWLSYAFPQLPGSHREAARRILSALEDIPVPKKSDEVPGVEDGR
ncbi:MAG: SIR2 family protein [Thermodesulfobacteriota bacterium]|nr:SIR2 family protein [Thermodesulfobacteriota bacterium]